MHYIKLYLKIMAVVFLVLIFTAFIILYINKAVLLKNNSDIKQEYVFETPEDKNSIILAYYETEVSKNNAKYYLISQLGKVISVDVSRTAGIENRKKGTIVYTDYYSLNNILLNSENFISIEPLSDSILN